MRIAMVSEHASPLAVLGGVDAGGQNVHVANLALGLARRGCQLAVYTRRDDRTIAKRSWMTRRVFVEQVDAGPPEPVSKDEMFRYMDDFADHLYDGWKRFRPDVVHAHFWMSGYAALAAARSLGIPVVLTFHALGVVKRRHQGPMDTSPPERLEVEADLVAAVDHVVATATDEVFELVRLGADVDRVSVVPCGADLSVFRPAGPAAPRTPGRARVVCVSRLVPRKGIETVIEAIGSLPDVELVVVGGPPADRLADDEEASRLRSAARRHGVADRVTLTGRLDSPQVAAMMRSADALVSVPWYEPFGIVPVEAMACGTPVVVSAVGGQIDTVIDGVTGVHVPPQDPQRLASSLGALLQDPQRRAALGAAGAVRARQRYAWDRVCASTLDVYRELAPVARTEQIRST